MVFSLFVSVCLQQTRALAAARDVQKRVPAAVAMLGGLAGFFAADRRSFFSFSF